MSQAIRDEKGNVVGYFLSEGEYRKWQYELAKAEFDRQEAIDKEAGVSRVYDGSNGMTTAQVLDLFRKLDEPNGGSK
jgi:hypothetical protein